MSLLERGKKVSTERAPVVRNSYSRYNHFDIVQLFIINYPKIIIFAPEHGTAQMPKQE